MTVTQLPIEIALTVLNIFFDFLNSQVVMHLHIKVQVRKQHLCLVSVSVCSIALLKCIFSYKCKKNSSSVLKPSDFGHITEST